MPLRRYIPATIVGGLFWAVIYATVGLAAFDAALAAAAGSPGALVLMLVAAAAVAVAICVARARRRKPAGGPDAERGAAAPAAVPRLPRS